MHIVCEYDANRLSNNDLYLHTKTAVILHPLPFYTEQRQFWCIKNLVFVNKRESVQFSVSVDTLLCSMLFLLPFFMSGRGLMMADKTERLKTDCKTR